VKRKLTSLSHSLKDNPTSSSYPGPSTPLFLFSPPFPASSKTKSTKFVNFMKLHPQTRSSTMVLGLSTSNMRMRVDLTCGCAFPTCHRVGHIPSSSHAFHCSHWSYVVVPISRYSLSTIGLHLPTLLTAIRCLAICRSYDGVFIPELWFRSVLSSAHPSTPARGMLFPLPKQCPAPQLLKRSCSSG